MQDQLEAHGVEIAELKEALVEERAEREAGVSRERDLEKIVEEVRFCLFFPPFLTSLGLSHSPRADPPLARRSSPSAFAAASSKSHHNGSRTYG